MKTYETFYKGSANHDDYLASYKSDFQRRLEALNAASIRFYEQTKVPAVNAELEAAIDGIFA